MTTNRSNAFNHYTIVIDGGETYTDKCRDTLGGYVNLVKRVAARIGTGSVCRLTAARGSSFAAFTDERTGTTGTITAIA